MKLKEYLKKKKAKPPRSGSAVRQADFSLLLLVPYMLAFLTFIVAPVIVAIALSFTDFDSVRTPNWVGLQNYIYLFHPRLDLHAVYPAQHPSFRGDRRPGQLHPFLLLGLDARPTDPGSAEHFGFAHLFALARERRRDPGHLGHALQWRCFGLSQ
jgi:ABC-type sugar transport system permease subunit